ncbi:MAG: hypothetical protein K5839_01535 [Treponemataceae bacterium]|nr:hypothetical protein [Treponemataceae bacterium]
MVYEFDSEKSSYKQRLSIFLHPEPDERRLVSILVTCDENNFSWLIEEPEKVKYGKNYYLGSSSLFYKDGEEFPEGQYNVSFTDMAGRTADASFKIKKVASLKNDSKFLARDVRLGRRGSECNVKKIILLDENREEIYCGNLPAKYDSNDKIKTDFPEAKYCRPFYSTRDNTTVIIMPEQKL